MASTIEPSETQPSEDDAAHAAGTSAGPYLFGDLLALARAQWIRRMAEGLAEAGYPDYRATDAVLVRLLRRRGSVTIGRLGVRLGITRQAARKLVDRLERRGYASEARDQEDARSVKVRLTADGERYADAVIALVHTLNRELAERVTSDELATADAVLRATISDPDSRAAADRVVPPLS
jgi:DNA-binding MarR family transcriptional regulator